MSIDDFCWPLSRLGEGIEELARRARLRPAPGEPIVPPESVVSGAAADLDHWIGWVGGRLGVDIQPIETMVPGVPELLAGAGPAVLRIMSADGPRFLFLLGSRFGSARLIATDLIIRSFAIEELRAAICAEHEAPLMASIDTLLNTADIRISRRKQVRSAIAAERLAAQRIGGCWMLRAPPTAGFSHQLVRENVPIRLLAVVGLLVAVSALQILAWSVIGDAALNGRVDYGWLAAWMLLMLSGIPLQLLGGWLDSTLAIDVSGLLKVRLLLGSLRLDVETVKHQGVGQLLGRVMECQALEALAVNGGLGALVAVIQLVFAGWILSVGSGGLLHLVLLAVWLGVTLALGWRYYGRLSEWTLMRLDMTHDLIEQMVGHRTRLAQEWPDRRDQHEDRSVKDYLTASSSMDRAILPFLAGVPSGWMLIGLLGLVPSFVAGSGTPAGFAIGLGGVILAGQAFTGIAGTLASAARAVIAWKQAAPLFRAGAKAASVTPYVTRGRARGGDRNTRLIEADSLSFQYLPDGDPVLDKASLSIAHGERILLEGASGGGKSTLTSLLVGLRQPDSGLLLLNGLDRHTLGDSWHEMATEAPQFHENHIFSGTMGFNLLMGRNWPATDDELEEAQELCVELGLEDLLRRMPSGMMQTVGESGWQLSHGERSRVFLARALLQGAQLTILDESFAALDPETLKVCLDCAFRRAETLVVIAHP